MGWGRSRVRKCRMRMSNSVFSFTISETNGDITAVSRMLRVTEEPRGPVEKIIVIEMHLQLPRPKAVSLGEFLICAHFGTSKKGWGGWGVRVWVPWLYK